MAEVEKTGLVPVKRAAELVGGLRVRWDSMGAGKKLSFSGGTLLLAAVAFGLAWYASRPDWRPLFSGLEARDVAQVSQELAAAGIPFQSTLDGSGVEVPAEMLDKARMEVAAKGMPQTGRLGFELFDKPNWVGSEFDERVNYQRALEGELEHTIGTLGMVRSARVHLVLPQSSLFSSEEKVAKASVVLKLKRASLPAEQVESIRNLVAGAVENLAPEQVTLVDADGRVSFAAKNRYGLNRDDEQEMQARLVAMLEPLAGVGNVRATVNVSYDDGTEERTDEVYDPTQSALLSSHKSEQTSAGSKAAQGIPGTASNTPAAAPSGAMQGTAKAVLAGTPPLLEDKAALPVFPQNGATGQSSREESGTFGVTRHVVHTEASPGRVRRVTAAVVVNDREIMEDSGKTAHATWKPRTTEEMHRLESLAQAAVGWDERRGDQVVVQNVSFSTNVPEPRSSGFERLLEETKGLLATQPALLKTGTLGMTGLLLVWFVLKPVATQVVVSMREPSTLAANRYALDQEVSLLVPTPTPGGVEGQRTETSANGPAGLEAEGGTKRRGAFEDVSRQIRRQPAQSTRLLETWITAEGEGL